MSLMSATKAIRNRMQVPLFKAGTERPSIMSASDMNVLVRALNALLNPSVVRGERDDATITDGNFVIDVSNADEATDTAVKQFILKDASFDDWLVCREWDGAAEVGGDVLVARP